MILGWREVTEIGSLKSKEKAPSLSSFWRMIKLVALARESMRVSTKREGAWELRKRASKSLKQKRDSDSI